MLIPRNSLLAGSREFVIETHYHEGQTISQSREDLVSVVEDYRVTPNRSNFISNSSSQTPTLNFAESTVYSNTPTSSDQFVQVDDTNQSSEETDTAIAGSEWV